MRGFLTRTIDRRLRRLALGATFGMAVVTTTAVATGNFKNPGFDDAHLAVEKAQILLSDSACGTPGERAADSCVKLIRTAEELLARAREAVTAAATAADGGDVASTLPH
jgi:hypothetical protein